MSNKRGEKSISITLISIFFILTAFLLFLHALINFNLRPIVRIFSIMQAGELQVPIFLILVYSLSRRIAVISAVEIAFALFTAYSAVEFFRLKDWARRSLTAVAPIEIVFFLGHIGFWALMATLLPDVTETLFMARSPEVLIALFRFYACAIFILLILPLIASFILLRTEKIRSAMS
jgi:hypothetical protein